MTTVIEEVLVVKSVQFDPMPGRERVAAAIENALMREGKDQKDLAAESGVGASTISDLLKCRQNLTIPIAARLGAVPWLRLSAIKLCRMAMNEE